MITDRQIDVPLLRKELEFITAHPERWRQSTWLQVTGCGTVGCLAGNTVLHAGLTPVLSELAPYAHVGAVTNVRDDDGLQRTIRQAAQRLLGLSDDQADRIFYPTNDLRTLWELAARYTDGEIQVPAELRDTDHRDDPYDPFDYDNPRD